MNVTPEAQSSNMGEETVVKSRRVVGAMKWLAILILWTVLVCYIFKINVTVPFEHYMCATSSPSMNRSFSNVCYQNVTISAGQSIATTTRGPIQHIYYLKNHKTGSTTIYFILAEYCRSKGLLPLLPTGVHINNQLPFRPSQLLLDPDVKKYDMVFNHHVYTPKIFQYLHNDTFRFTTLRQPLSQFLSAFYYFRNVGKMKYLTAIPDPDPLGAFLAHPQKYEAEGYTSFTNNRQSVDLGFKLSHSMNDTQYIRAFISECENNFNLILITDYFEQSIVLLKRTLRWQTSDVIYFRKNSGSNATKLAPLTDLQREQHRNFSSADFSLYNHFLRIFKHRISREHDLPGEAEELKSILEKIHDFCEAKHPTTKQLIIPPGRWSDQVSFLRSKCKWLKLDELSFTAQLKRIKKDVLLKD